MQARLLHFDQVRLPPTREVASENVFRVPRSLGIGDIDAAAILDLILKADALLVCPCALADNRRACLRQQWVSRLCYRPRVRARAPRRQRHRGSGERAPPGDNGDGDGPPPPRLKSAYGPRAEVIPQSQSRAPRVVLNGRAP